MKIDIFNPENANQYISAKTLSEIMEVDTRVILHLAKTGQLPAPVILGDNRCMRWRCGDLCHRLKAKQAVWIDKYLTKGSPEPIE